MKEVIINIQISVMCSLSIENNAFNEKRWKLLPWRKIIMVYLYWKFLLPRSSQSNTRMLPYGLMTLFYCTVGVNIYNEEFSFVTHYHLKKDRNLRLKNFVLFDNIFFFFFFLCKCCNFGQVFISFLIRIYLYACLVINISLLSIYFYVQSA